MKNNVVLTLTSSPEGKVTGQLSILGELTLRSISPADIKTMLRERGIQNFAFMGSREGKNCSFPMTLFDLSAIASIIDDADQALFLAQLHDKCTLSLGIANPRHTSNLPLITCQLDSEDATADTAEFRVAAEVAGWTQDEINHAVEKARLACEEPSEIGDMLYLYCDASLKAKYVPGKLAV